MNRFLLLFVILLSAVAAESIRETETMDPTSMLEYEASGSHRIDIGYDDEDDDVLDEDDYSSGSGDEDIYTDGFDIEDDDDDDDDYVEMTTLGNRIPEEESFPKGRKIESDFDMNAIDSNEIPYASKPVLSEPSNKIAMASTGSSNFFQRTEVIVAIIAGTLVGLLVAICVIVVLVIRRNKNMNGDLVKKPIYKKTSTIEV
ncbi:hypothetical protein GDO86_014323 [Hymenochirus boettgeri]|uniref:Syndecan/Neurexin domain-containing protein n=1 Tax=Hymenochirus boettgeri TaxID=247094 RepID=A0A8T2JRC3_9PIPI|nr:hypothetical protein GDO86_014323 [Hymenochirus boettgeri]